MEVFMTKPRNLWIMCGIPASGKSYKSKELVQKWEDCKYVSRDKIRFALITDEDEYFNKEKEVWRQYVAEIQDGIFNHLNTIADATHLNWASRSKLLNALRGLDKVAVNCYYFPTSLETCLKRNALREGRTKVPEQVMHNMYKSFTNPTFDPYEYHIIGEMINE